MPTSFVVCVAAPADATASTAPCVDVGGVHYVPTVLDLPTPGVVTFDNAGVLFSFALSAVLIFWALGIGVGAVLSTIREGRD